MTKLELSEYLMSVKKSLSQIKSKKGKSIIAKRINDILDYIARHKIDDHENIIQLFHMEIDRDHRAFLYGSQPIE